ncbi:MAG: cation transporter, partial [Psittacicella sp.]
MSKKVYLALSGVTCASCIATINKGLKNNDKIDYYELSLADKTATIESSLSTEEVIGAIKSIGYGAEVIEDQEQNLENKKIKDQKAYKSLLKKGILAILWGGFLTIYSFLGIDTPRYLWIVVA